MKLLLDTHAFLWWTLDEPSLSPAARKAISDRRNQIYLSAASGWEIVIKAGLGRLKLPEPPERFIPQQMSENAIEGLPIRMSHVLRVFALDAIHRDPFDRILVAQSQLEKMRIITADPLISRYGADVIW